MSITRVRTDALRAPPGDYSDVIAAFPAEMGIRDANLVARRHIPETFCDLREEKFPDSTSRVEILPQVRGAHAAVCESMCLQELPCAAASVSDPRLGPDLHPWILAGAG
jgi:hypothetical protein